MLHTYFVKFCAISASRSTGIVWEFPSYYKLEPGQWSDKLQPLLVNNQWGDDEHRNKNNGRYESLHANRPDQRDDILLRGDYGQRGRGVCGFEPGERDTAGIRRWCADEPRRDARKCPGSLDVDGGEWSDGVQSLSVDDFRTTRELDRHAYERKLYGYECYEWDDILLRGDSDKRWRGVSGFEPGECDAAGTRAECADEPQRDAGECPGSLDVDGGEWSDGVQGLSVDDIWTARKLDRDAYERKLHGFNGYKRNDVLLHRDGS